MPYGIYLYFVNKHRSRWLLLGLKANQKLFYMYFKMLRNKERSEEQNLEHSKEWLIYTDPDLAVKW